MGRVRNGKRAGDDDADDDDDDDDERSDDIDESGADAVGDRLGL